MPQARRRHDAGDKRQERSEGHAPPRAEQPALSALLALQRSAGNAAVSAVLQRNPLTDAPPTSDAIAKLKELLEDGDEEGAIMQCGRLSRTEAAQVLGMDDIRDEAVDTFNDEEMARAVASLRGGSLKAKIRWLIAEGSNLGLVWPLLVDEHTPAEEKTALFTQNDIRAFFIDLCDNDEMASLVDVLGGQLVQKLHWMLLEGTSWKAVIEKINAHTDENERKRLYEFDFMRDLFVELLGDAEMAALVQMLGGTLDNKLAWMAAEGTNGQLVFSKVRAADEADLQTVTGTTRAAIKGEIDAEDFVRFEQMLDQGLLNWEEVDREASEQHYERDDENNWELKTFDWDTKYEILYTRTELRVKVRIALEGVEATEAHKTIWRDGIANRWNNKFHVANDRHLAVVFEPEFTNSDPHHTVELHPPPIDREDSGNWYAGPTANADSSVPPDTTTGDTAAHEFGHLVGLEDEYRLTAQDFERLIGHAPTAADADDEIGYTDPGLMSAGQGDVQGRHLRTFVAWLNAHRRAGEKPYRLVAGP
jgi:hypothetical protein